MEKSKQRISGVYTVTVTGILVLAFLICAVYIPMGSFMQNEFLSVMRVNRGIISMVFCMTILAVTILGIESLIFDFEITQDKVLESSEVLNEKLDAWSKNLDG
ncbi:MAG: hypothetical protein QF415_07180 [Candidatus Undinarchaeales archaeon]|jgi:hypothetical protein|nr:hypothetical protein [Candidatus Undinarchaeales archaeon]